MKQESCDHVVIMCQIATKMICWTAAIDEDSERFFLEKKPTFFSERETWKETQAGVAFPQSDCGGNSLSAT